MASGFSRKAVAAANQTFVDHLGRERAIDTRNDVRWHHVQAFLKGWVYGHEMP